ncbi:cytosolic Fe-S cluster assembly factor NAR1 [Cryptococcus depauperatus]|nr:cytosolic Fe-S cluster assembly factor NAR1 [Cryptococcus depauperatus CBS 7855]
MAFTGALTITDLDDFLTPSQACIIPIRNSKQSEEKEGQTDIQIDSDNNYYEVSLFPTINNGPEAASTSKKVLEKAEINLNDCLACSGCITSTESMLITMQSQNEVLDFIKTNLTTSNPDAPLYKPRVPVLSISPQTLASLSAAYSSTSSLPPIPLLVLLRRIRALLSQPSNGSWKVWDTTFARHVSLRETVAEFDERRKGKGKAVGMPTLASACPGWVCYAEKAQGDLLPLLSSVRSSQAIVGALVKSWYAQKTHLKPNEIYHITAMPCYDKKLEASRSDFYSSLYSTRDVDCVLTTGELDLLLQELGFNPYISVPNETVPLDTPTDDSPFPELLTHQGSSSGSYLQSIIHNIQHSHPNPTQISIREIRGSADNVEYLLHDLVTGQIIFKGSKVYGFQNLQNLVRKVAKETGIGRSGRSAGGGRLSAAVAARRRKAKVAASTSTPAASGAATPESTRMDVESIASLSLSGAEDTKLDFVEVMACPSGCINGGGQIKPDSSSVDARNVADSATETMEVDEEGYPRPLADDGSDKNGSMTTLEIGKKRVKGMEEGMRWSTKEWVNKVEQLYWTGLPTPPLSPSLTTSNPNYAATHSQTQDSNVVGNSLLDGVNRNAQADQLTEEIIRQVCEGDMDKRWEFLRTRYRKVENDILSSVGVAHEAVKW